MQLKDLQPHPGNPRKITDEKLKMLEKSLKQFGDLSGIVFNKKTSRLIGGHQRLKVISPGSPIVIDAEDSTRGYILSDGEKHSLRIVEWDEMTEEAANIAANKGAGEWDYPLLIDMMNRLDASNIDLSLTMFDEEERDRLLGGWDSDIDLVNNTEEHLEGIAGKIIIECPPETKDEVLIYIKGKLLESSFEGIHVK